MGKDNYIEIFLAKRILKKLIISYWEACGQVSSINPFKITMFKKKKIIFPIRRLSVYHKNYQFSIQVKPFTSHGFHH